MELKEPLLLTILNIPFGVIFYLLFTGPSLGFGHKIANELRNQENVIDEVFIGTVVLVLLIYLLDIMYWETFVLKYLKFTCIFLVGGGLTTTALFIWNQYPSIPVALFIIIFPIHIYGFRVSIFHKSPLYQFMRSIGTSLIILSILMLIPWIVWVSTKYPWGDETKKLMAEVMECDDPDDCQPGYILWISPLIASIASFIFGWISLLLSPHLEYENSSMVMAKSFIVVIILSVIGVWVSASIAGSNMKLAQAVNILIISSIIIFVTIILETFGWESIQKELLKIAIVQKVSKLIASKWAKAFFAVFILPLIPVYLLMSLLRHNIRKIWCFGKPLSESDKKNILGNGAIKQIQKIRQWNFASIFPKMIWVCIIYLVIFVGIGKIVTIFMSYLNGELEAFNLGIVTVIFFNVGLLMFLLPPVPGVPVYLAGGIIIVSKGQDLMSYWGAIGYMIGIGFILKMLAIVIQQKVFGELMGKSIYIRNLVNVNSPTVKTIRLILQQKGLKFDKVCILIGGPDWPTSVLTGILKLNVFDMLYGSLPVIILIAPCVIAAAFFLKDSDSWQTTGTIAITLAGIVQFGAMLLAAYYLEKYAKEHGDEIDEIPDDEEVNNINNKKRYEKYLFKMVSHWHPKQYPESTHIKTVWQSFGMPVYMKINLILGALMGCLSCYIALYGSSESFETFEVTDTIDEKLDGNALNIVKNPWGWISLSLLLGSILCLIIYYIWHQIRFHCFVKDNDIDIHILPRNWDIEKDDDLESETEEDIEPMNCNKQPISFKSSVRRVCLIQSSLNKMNETDV